MTTHLQGQKPMPDKTPGQLTALHALSLINLVHHIRLTLNGHSSQTIGLSFEEAQLLDQVDQLDGHANVTKIAARLERTSHSTTARLRRLEDRGFLRRIRQDTDRRMIYVTLTPSGAEKLAAFREQGDALLETTLESISGDLSKDEAGLLTQALRAVTNELHRSHA